MEYLSLLASAAASALLNSAAVFRRRPPSRIVVFKLDHLGDLVTAAPALQELRRRYPRAEITLVVGSWNEGLARLLGGHDALVLYDSPVYARARGRRADASERGVGEILRGSTYDIAIGLRDDWSSIAFCLRGGAARRRDRGTVRLAHSLRRIFFQRPCRGGGEVPLNEVETNLRVVGKRSPPGGTPVPRIRVPDAGRARVGRLLSEWGVEDKLLVVVHPGAGWEPRRWPADRYAAVARSLASEYGAVAVVTGSAPERSIAEEVAACEPSCRVAAGLLGVAELAALVERAVLFVGSDTGVTHLAVAVGTPVVALFGPEAPARFGSFGPRDAVVYHGVDCSPCSQRRCRRGAECMLGIGADEVVAATRRVMSAVPSIDRRLGPA